MIEKSALKINAKSLSYLNDQIDRATKTHIANGWLLVNVSRTVIDGYSAVVQLIRRVEGRKEPVDDADARPHQTPGPPWAATKRRGATRMTPDDTPRARLACDECGEEA